MPLRLLNHEKMAFRLGSDDRLNKNLEKYINYTNFNETIEWFKK